MEDEELPWEAAKAAYYLEFMEGADAARCSWIKRTISEFECVFRGHALTNRRLNVG